MDNNKQGKIIIENTTEWNEFPKPDSNLVALLRQFVATEYDGTRLYTHVPSLDDIESTGAMEALILKYGTKEECQKFYSLLEGSNSTFPFAGTIHEFLRTYDSHWYNTSYEPKFN